MNSFNYWQLLAGISAFVFAMSLLEGSVKSLSGRAFKKFLEEQTSGKFRALLTGTFITALLQSSSVVVLMTLSFVGAGIIPLRNALAVALGSNLGTTFNSWIVAYAGFSMELNAYAYPIMAICLLGFVLFPKNKNARGFATMLFGLALLFIGLQWMKDSAPGLQQLSALKPYLTYSPYWFLLIGFVVTVILQSSSVTFALSLTGIQSGLFPVSTAVFMVIGAELGTTIKIVVGAVNGSSDQKRLAAANFTFNFTTLLVAVLFVSPLLWLLQNVVNVSNPFLLLASFQSTLNVIGIFIFYPWLGTFSRIVENLFRKTKAEAAVRLINPSGEFSYGDAVRGVEKEMMRLLSQVVDYNRLIVLGEPAAKNGKERWYGFWRSLLYPVSPAQNYERIKLLQAEILDFLVDLSDDDLSPAEEAHCSTLITASRYLLVASKHIKDIQHNLEDLSATANDDLFSIFKNIQKEEEEFLLRLQPLFAEVPAAIEEKTIALLQQENKNRQVSANEQVFHLLQQHKITQVNASTMLNVHRAIYSSHHTLLNALVELCKKPEV